MPGDVTGVREVLINLDRTLDDFPERAERAVVQILALLVTEAKLNHPYTDRTGNLTNSIAGDVVQVATDYVIGVFYASMSYAAFVERVASGSYSYMLPAIEANRDKMREILRREFSL